MMDRLKEIMRTREQVPFLGYEFLTWVFLLLNRDNAKDDIADLTKDLLAKTEKKILLGTRLVTCLFNHKEQKTSVACPVLEDSHEVFASLKNGHLVESLSLVIALDEISVSLMIHAQDFALTQVKIKNNFDNESLNDDEEKLDEEDMMREEIFLRMSVLSEIELIMDRLLGHFLALRLDHKRYGEAVMGMAQQIDQQLHTQLRKQDKKNSVDHVEALL